MKGVIFAAGLGTRLYPLTKDKPKALVEVQGKVMLGRVLDRMAQSNIRQVVVNVHAFADKVEEYLRSYVALHPEMNIVVSDERACLLETGGGLLKMQPWLDEPFIVCNVDVLSDVNLNRLNIHEGSIATLAVRKIESDRYFLFNQKGLLCGWENVRTGERKMARPLETNLQRYGFTGIHRIQPQLLSLITEQGIFSITDVYLRLAANHDIHMLDVSDAMWFDIGSLEQLTLAEQNTSME